MQQMRAWLGTACRAAVSWRILRTRAGTAHRSGACAAFPQSRCPLRKSAGGVAIMLATRRYVDRALDGAAVLRTLE